eukprot:s7668_g6.t1
MRLLELFSGTKSVGRAFEALGWEVTSLDADATTRPTICADVQAWDYGTYPPRHFDLIWASPVCTEFSRALTRRPRRLEDGDRLVLKTIEIIGHLRWEVTSLDADATTRPTICADVQAWDYGSYPPGHFDFIWASPVCTYFSRALTRRPRRLTEGDGLVLKTIEIIGHLRPRWWAVENPRTGLLKSRPYMQALPYNDVSYCMYGFRYQ